MRWRDWVSGRLAALAIAVAVLVLGGSPRWVQAIVAFLMVAALSPEMMSRRVFARLSPLVLALGIAIMLCLIQIVSLPHSIVEALSAKESGLRDDGVELMHVTARATLSFDVPGTLRALAYFLTLLGVAVLALRASVTERGRYNVLAVVAGVCGLGALVIGVNYIFGIHELYGVFTPTNGPHVIGPMFNPNHLGCLMALGACCSIGLVAYRKQRTWLRALWLVLVGMCSLSTLATLSRGGNLALAVGAFVTVGILIAQRWLAKDGEGSRERSSVMTSSLPIAIVAACMVVVVLYAGAGGISQQFSQTSFNEIEAPRSKFAAWKSAAAVIDESPWVGIGRGAFEPVFTRVHPASGYSTFSHVENEYLQAVVDWGVPGALILACAAIWLVVVGMRRWRDGPLAAAAMGAVVVVALQSNVDYGVELLGIAMPITAVIATLTYVPLVEATAKRTQLIRRASRVVHVLALLTVGFLLCSDSTTSLDEDHIALSDQRNLTLDRLRKPAERHPLDYFNYAIAAQLMIRERDPLAISMLNHAMTLHPSHAGLHLIAAHLLYDTHHAEQATVEYEIALPPSKNHRKLIEEIAQKFPASQAALALPTTATLLDEIARELADMKREDIAIAWLDHVLDLAPNLPHACDLLFAIAARAQDHILEIVSGRRCAKYEASRENKLALAHAFDRKHEFAQVTRLTDDVESWTGQNEQKIEGWLLLCDAETGLQKWNDARHCLRRLDAAGLLPSERASEIANRLERIRQAEAAAFQP